MDVCLLLVWAGRHTNHKYTGTGDRMGKRKRQERRRWDQIFWSCSANNGCSNSRKQEIRIAINLPPCTVERGKMERFEFSKGRHDLNGTLVWIAGSTVYG